MNAQNLLKENAAKAAEVAKLVEATAGALAGMLEKKSGAVAEVVEKQSGALADAFGSKAGPLVKAVEVKADALGSMAGPIVKAVEVKADALGDALEETLEKARDDAMKAIKGFKFGQREAILLGVAVGVIAVVAISRRIDRERAAERLRAARVRAGESAQALGARVSESAHELGAKVSPAVATVTSKAGELAGQVKEEVTTRASGLAEQLRPGNGRHVEGETGPTEYTLPETPAQELDEARQRLSAERPSIEAAAEGAPAEGAPAEDVSAELTPAATDAQQPAADAEPAAGQEPRIKVSDGMKVVAFDGTDIGRVQETREDVFVLDRPRGADLLVPLDQVARIEGTVVYLRVEAGRVSKMGWEKGDPS